MFNLISAMLILNLNCKFLLQGRTLALDLSLVVGIEPIAGTFTKRYMLKCNCQLSNAKLHK